MSGELSVNFIFKGERINHSAEIALKNVKIVFADLSIFSNLLEQFGWDRYSRDTMGESINLLKFLLNLRGSISKL